jgi:hypothetical protein
MLKSELLQEVKKLKVRGPWGKGVKLYAVELVESIEAEEITGVSEEMFLNGAQTWLEYSEGGCALIYDTDIAERLCSPTAWKSTKGGTKQPGAHYGRCENWLSVQARALISAYILIKEAFERG